MTNIILLFVRKSCMMNALMAHALPQSTSHSVHWTKSSGMSHVITPQYSRIVFLTGTFSCFMLVYGILEWGSSLWDSLWPNLLPQNARFNILCVSPMICPNMKQYFMQTCSLKSSIANATNHASNNNGRMLWNQMYPHSTNSLVTLSHNECMTYHQVAFHSTK